MRRITGLVVAVTAVVLCGSTSAHAQSTPQAPEFFGQDKNVAMCQKDEVNEQSRHAKGRRSYVTSAGAGPSLGKHILLSYLPPERANVGEQLAVEYLGERYPVTVDVVGSTPIFDPENARIRS